MEQEDAESLLAQIDLLLREEIDLISSDSESTERIVKLLTAAARYLNQWLRNEYGGHPGSDRSSDLLEQIIAAPFQSFGGQDLHPDPFERAAMLWRGITQGHPFGDGNKRCGFAMASYYLELMGFASPQGIWDEEELYAFNIQISVGEVREISQIVERLWEWWGVEHVNTPG